MVHDQVKQKETVIHGLRKTEDTKPLRMKFMQNSPIKLKG